MNTSASLIKETALKTINIENQAINGLKNSINDSFVAVIELIFRSEGRVVLTGIGKSALVAQKIVATLNSTGTPSIFLHAADAIHGDLGMVQPNDHVVCLSKSGETPEIRVLLPLLKNLGNIVIGMVSRSDSFLAKKADYVMLTPIEQEADPNNLAPTASTTAQMVLGDAMATALLALRGFTPKDFAQFHPGGALGKQLYLRVKDLFPQNEKPSVLPDSNLRSIIVEMTSKRLGATAVIDQDKKVRGIITDGDLRRMLESETNLEGILASAIMSADPIVIHDNEMAVKALQIMRKNSITQLIVTSSNGVFQGFIHLHDLIREGLI
ncbi:MAG: KpsF/GutQ family sugar-phosphate isomerase [Saprospiraceae bacterium]|nr:KpsF/GutQ family sugar-phosphate isomerase [Saprospiraceae bacterium]